MVGKKLGAYVCLIRTVRVFEIARALSVSLLSRTPSVISASDQETKLGKMSEYFRCLLGHAKARYVEKLHLLGLAECDDPYSDSNSSKFVEDLTLWPAVEYGH